MVERSDSLPGGWSGKRTCEKIVYVHELRLRKLGLATSETETRAFCDGLA